MSIHGCRAINWRYLPIVALVFMGSGLGTAFPSAVGQENPLDGFGQFGGLDAGGFAAPGDDEPITLSASFQVGEGTNRGRLLVQGQLSNGWHVYSITQKKGGPTPTKIAVKGPEGVTAVGPFVPDAPPHKSLSTVWEGLEVEEHEDKVVWTAPIEFAGELAATQPTILVKIDGLTCQTDGSCVPFSETLPAKFTGTYQVARPTTQFRDANYAVEWKIELVPGAAAPGSEIALQLTATPDEGFHVYQASTKDEKSVTNLVLTQLSGLKGKAPQASTEPVKKDMGPAVGEAVYHEGPVTWTIPIEIPEDAREGEYTIAGLVGYQACTDQSCLQPKALQFSGTIRVGTSLSDVPRAVSIQPAKYRDVLTAAAENHWVDDGKEAAEGGEAEGVVTLGGGSGSKYSLGVILGMAVLGGLILNLMPCVLPVIGLKMMSLVEGAGDEHSKVLKHNIFYSLGILSVFWVLAAVAIIFRWSTGESFAWGEQFNYFEFRTGVTLLVFVMALSFLGTWEIPLPGFASGKTSQQLQKQEGASGSFFKGLFTTILATPCSGPFLGAVFGFTMSSSPQIIFLVFSAIGFGMSMPFLLIGLVPKLVFWLPKPGAWMETLKQLMGFMLLGSVAFFFSWFPEAERVPIFVTLIGAWFACWMIGRVPQWDTLNRRLTAWGGGIAIATIIGVVAFTQLAAGPAVVAWEPYDEVKLASLRAQGRTVMVDFTADWCLNCKLNYKRALNTEETARMLADLDAVPMLAVWHEGNESEIKKILGSLESNSIPLLAIYPGDRPNQPIVLRDIISQSDVLEALQTAGPSRDGSTFALTKVSAGK